MIKNKNKGITLIALTITIIVFLIISAITINSIIGDNGLQEQSQKMKDNSLAEQDAEGKRINSLYTDISSDSNIQASEKGDIVLTPNVVYSFTEKKALVDEYGNKIVIPEGFKILNDSTTNAIHVNEGIVITDSLGNEFVWIPTGDIYTNSEKSASVNIGFDRYENYDPVTYYLGTDYIEENRNGTLLNNGNTIATDIYQFEQSVDNNHGFYIGRYEGRTTSSRTSTTNALTAMTEKKNDYVYNYLKQPDAASLCKSMYTGKTFTSDMVNGAAWDTAVLFATKLGGKGNYGNAVRVTTTFAEKGTNNLSTTDKVCNIYDMAGNCWEWDTETYKANNTAVCRGGLFFNGTDTASTRQQRLIGTGDKNYSTRPVLVL